MADHSASDREGAGSTPASGFPGPPSFYAGWQLARALAASEHATDDDARRRASERSRKWRAVIEGVREGSLAVGSRTPVEKTPAWATLEVLQGGFATGHLLAGGPLHDHEAALARRLNLPESRHHLNLHFLTEPGLADLSRRLAEGTYQITVPEEGALPAVAWLTAHGRADLALEILDHLEPFLPTLRFYPRPADRPVDPGPGAHARDIASTVRSLEAVRTRPDILAQQDTVRRWLPLYDEAIALLLETVEGPPPAWTPGVKGSITGGWPCRRFPEGWTPRARAWVHRVDEAAHQPGPSRRATHRKSSLAQLLPPMRKAVDDPASLTGREVGLLRLVLARTLTASGPPGSPAREALRGRQARQASTPIHTRIAAAVAARLAPWPVDGGAANDSFLAPISPDESAAAGAPAGTALPDHIRRKAERCLHESIAVLVQRGILTSGESLARILPQVTSGVRALAYPDQDLRRLAAAIDRAFRARRSLLLLNLESQVKLHELPWFRALDAFRDPSPSTRSVSLETLRETARLALTHFPHAVLPNKLLQEISALAKAAGIPITLTEELAADIFMGRFGEKFARAARDAGSLLRGTLYERYYRIDFDALPEPADDAPKAAFFGLWKRPAPSDRFGPLCQSRAGVTPALGSPAANGMVIEQQQVLTTQNLAQVIAALGLQDPLRDRWADLAAVCLDRIRRGLTRRAPHHHARLIAIKIAAYAWRQMLVYLSLAPAHDRAAFPARAEALLERDPPFRRRFAPALAGLADALAGRDAATIFLGWSTARHWLMDPPTPAPGAVH